MKPEFKFLNFNPSLGVREHARNILNEIEQIGPSDATVRGDLEYIFEWQSSKKSYERKPDKMGLKW